MKRARNPLELVPQRGHGALSAKDLAPPGPTRTFDLRFRKLCDGGLRGSTSRLGASWVAQLGKAWSYESEKKLQKKQQRSRVADTLRVRPQRWKRIRSRGRSANCG